MMDIRDGKNNTLDFTSNNHTGQVFRATNFTRDLSQMRINKHFKPRLDRGKMI
jgi:hypothetical protein